jgi:hypothetical protein
MAKRLDRRTPATSAASSNASWEPSRRAGQCSGAMSSNGKHLVMLTIAWTLFSKNEIRQPKEKRLPNAPTDSRGRGTRIKRASKINHCVRGLGTASDGTP